MRSAWRYFRFEDQEFFALIRPSNASESTSIEYIKIFITNLIKNYPIYVVFSVISIIKISLIHYNYFQTDKIQNKTFNF